jgi:hypothetical protein
VRGRLWLVIGAGLGLALSLGEFPYLAGAARSLADTAEQLVGAGGHHLLTTAATHGAARRSVLIVTALVGVLLPGLTALLLVLAARGALRIRAVVGLLILALSAASFAYHPHGVAAGTIVLALAVAGVAVAVSGPLVVLPLCALAGLICGQWLPRILDVHSDLPGSPVDAVHQAVWSHPGTPTALRIALLVFAGIPFAVAARLVVAK